MKPKNNPVADVVIIVIVIIAALAHGLIFKILGGIP